MVDQVLHSGFVNLCVERQGLTCTHQPLGCHRSTPPRGQTAPSPRKLQFSEPQEDINSKLSSRLLSRIIFYIDVPLQKELIAQEY